MSVDLLGDNTPLAAPAVLTVSQLNARVKELLEDEFGEVLVEGEISSWRTYPSGHSYFDLKDAASKVRRRDVLGPQAVFALRAGSGHARDAPLPGDAL